MPQIVPSPLARKRSAPSGPASTPHRDKRVAISRDKRVAISRDKQVAIRRNADSTSVRDVKVLLVNSEFVAQVEPGLQDRLFKKLADNFVLKHSEFKRTLAPALQHATNRKVLDRVLTHLPPVDLSANTIPQPWHSYKLDGHVLARAHAGAAFRFVEPASDDALAGLDAAGRATWLKKHQHALGLAAYADLRVNEFGLIWNTERGYGHVLARTFVSATNERATKRPVQVGAFKAYHLNSSKLFETMYGLQEPLYQLVYHRLRIWEASKKHREQYLACEKELKEPLQ